MFLENINDITISKGIISVSRETNLTSKDIEQQISLIRYSPSTYGKSDLIENTRMPPYIQVFYYLFFKELRIPTFDAFVQTYKEWISKPNMDSYLEQHALTMDAITARMNRTFPSLLRDVHFLYLLDEDGFFENVNYSMEKDYLNGIDISFNKNSQEYYISLFIDTSRAKYFKKKKTHRHGVNSSIEIELNVDFNSLSKRGDIYLLNNQHIKLLKEILTDYAKG